MSKPFKVQLLLSREELDQLEEFVRNKPARSVDECHEWIQSHGYTLARSSTGRWLEEFRLNDHVRQSAELAQSYIDIASNSGAIAMPSAALGRFQQLLFEALARADELDAGQLMKLSIALKTAVGAQQGIEQLREKFDAAAKKLTGSGREITADDIQRVSKEVFG